MRDAGRVILFTASACLIGAAGCAARRTPAAAPAAQATTWVSAGATTVPPVPQTATLPLDQIMPPAVLPAPATPPATQPARADRPPLQALTLYAEATDNLLKGRREAAIPLLEKAAALDPGSFELQAALARAYRGGGGHDERSLAALERAAAIDPDHVELQADLARQYLARGDSDKALWHLRLALKTSDYANPAKEADAAVAELFAGRALARAGYHAAAVEVYERLFRRLERPSFALRGDPETAFLLARPEVLRLQVAESYEKTGRLAEALKAYEAAVQRAPNDLAIKARAVGVLVAMRRFDDAAARAADAVARSQADPRAVELLRQVCRAAGREGALADELRRLREKRPRDAAVLFALADVLRGEGKAAEAFALLRRASAGRSARGGLVRRLYACALETDPSGQAAARFLVDWSAEHPDAVHLAAGHWDDLILPNRPYHLDLRDLQRLEPGEGYRGGARWEPAKWYWVAQVARLRHRQELAREALPRARASGVVFAPAFRSSVGTAAGRAAEELAERAETLKDPALAAELRGLSLLEANQYAGARAQLDEAARCGGSAPELHFARAVAARGAGDLDAYEQILWKVLSDWPDFDDAYETLYGHYSGRGAAAAAVRVLSAWVAADRSDVTARLLQVREGFAAGRADLAARALEELLAQHAHDPRVLSAARAYYRQSGGTDAFVKNLTERHAAEPSNLPAAAQLADVLAEQGRYAEASRVLDATRAALAGDPDLLYEVAHLYGRVGQKLTTERVLRDVLRLDPSHAAAANDLGYQLADEGRELDEAERLTRRAVESDPGNPSFLDSLGWVLYKRGRFDEARAALVRAADASREKDGAPDAIVLDHLGDATYRAGDAAGAMEQWKRAMERVAGRGAEEGNEASPPAGGDDHPSLRLRLERKTKQAAAGQPVSVAPVPGAVPVPGAGASTPESGAAPRSDGAGE